MTFTLDIPEPLEARLESVARSVGRSKDECARAALEAGLDDLDDARLADDVTVRLRSGAELTWTHEEVVRDLGLAD